MFVRSTALRVAIAGLSALALAATVTPALAGAGDKAANPLTGSLDARVSGVTDITQQIRKDAAGGVMKYSYDNEVIYWSVTAVKPRKKADIALYEDADNTVLLAQSKLKRKAIDFVVVDSNHAVTPSTWYPTVTSSGSGKYTVQNDTDAEILFCDGAPQPYELGKSDIVKALDVNLSTTAASWTITVDVPAKASIDLMDSADATDNYQARKDATMSDTGTGTLSISASSDDDWHGLILTKAGGSGTYTFTCTAD